MMVGHDEGYTTISSEELGFITHTFGDFEFAFSKRELRKIKGAKAEFDSILCFAVTREPFYDYYLLADPSADALNTKGFTFKDTLLNNHRVVIAVSNHAPESDRKFILESIELK